MKVAEEKARNGESRLTVDDVLRLYNTVGDGNKYEIIQGRLIVTEPVCPAHGELRSLVNWLIWDHELADVKPRTFSGAGVKFSQDTLTCPDVTVVTGQDDVEFKQTIVGVPSLIVEIQSISKSALDLVSRCDLYRSSGVREVWCLDVKGKEAMFLSKRNNDHYDVVSMTSGIFESKVLKGFKLDVAALFALDKKRLRKVLESK
jgi:Uma2 family endonuclease